jgi:uracil-DNA glycosylase family 4
MDAALFPFVPKDEDISLRTDAAWNLLQSRLQACADCPLSDGRTNVVPGEGYRESPVLFIGEAPGADEDIQGRPFVGRAGQLLTQILSSGGIQRKDAYITNVVKCRPPQNRVPTVQEMMFCNKYLESQIALINPKIIVCLGNTPLKWLTKTTEGITSLRGKWLKWRGIDFFPMFHPSYLLRNDSRKAGSPKHLTWQDVQELRKRWDEISGSHAASTEGASK